MRNVLVVGGQARVQLAWCRQLGTATRVSLLRWDRTRSFADASRYCAHSIWLGSVDEGIARWRARFEAFIRKERVSAVVPADPLAHVLLCGGGMAFPAGVDILGPDREAHAIGADRLRVFELARETGWLVPDWQHVVRPGPLPTCALPCTIRPRRDVTVVDDEPVRFSTKSVSDADALDAKLRDDVPRGEVLVQPLPPPTMRLSVTARHGVMLGLWTPRAASRNPDEAHALVECTRGLVRALDWTGLLEIEYAIGAGSPMLVDLRCGGGMGLVEATRAGAFLARRLATGGVAGAPVVVAEERSGVDPLPHIAVLAEGLLAAANKIRHRVRATLWNWTSGQARTPLLSRSLAILVVCKGNINRSMVAEQVFRANGYEHVASAGLLGLGGRRPSRAAEQFLTRRFGVQVASLRSQSLRRALERCSPFDIVLCFERRQAIELRDRYPELRGRIHLFTTLDPDNGGPQDIADPHGRTETEYLRCFARIERILNSAIARRREPPAVAHGAREHLTDPE